MCNVGKVDRIVRSVLGIALIGWGVIASSWWGAIGIVPLATGLMGFCPLYTVLKIDTGCKVEETEQKEEA